MQVGDKILAVPTFTSTAGMEVVLPQWAEVVYISKEHRFYRLRFTANGHSFCESFHMTDERIEL